MRANEDIHTEGDLVLDSCTDDAVKAFTVEVANETLNKTVKSVHVEKDIKLWRMSLIMQFHPRTDESGCKIQVKLRLK